MVIWAIGIYQRTLSPLIGAHCIFEPSCSQYGVEAFRKYGFFRAFVKTVGRVARCNPWSVGGKDPA